MSVRRRLVVRGGLLLVAAGILSVIAVLSGPAQPTDDPSSYSSSPSGTLALYNWLGELGYAMRRMDSSFDPGDASAVIVYAPVAPLTADEITTLQKFAKRGGTIIVASDYPTQVGDYAAALGVDATSASQNGDASTTIPLDGTGKSMNIPWGYGMEFTGGRDSVPLATVGDSAVAVSSGAVLLGSSAPLSNQGLRQGDSWRFVLSLISLRPGASIAFDEAHRGGSKLEPIVYGPVGLAFLIAALIILLTLITSGRRIGKPQPASREVVLPTAADHIGAVADLFELSSSRSTLAFRLVNDLRMSMVKRFRLSPDASDEELVQAVRGYDPANAGVLAAILTRGPELAGRANDRDLLGFAQQVTELEQRLVPHARASLQQWRP